MRKILDIFSLPKSLYLECNCMYYDVLRCNTVGFLFIFDDRIVRSMGDLDCRSSLNDNK